MALVNAQQNWRLPSEANFELLDYQVPLKAARSDREIGKIDILGLSDVGRIVVLELKVVGHSGGFSDPPPVALLEGLRYASIVEANQKRIAKEICERFGRMAVSERPIFIVLGEASWWANWLGAKQGIKNAFEQKSK